MKTTISVDVGAPPEVVFRLCRDVERWPRLLPHYVSVRAGERRADGSVVARFVALRQLVPLLGLALPVAWRSRTWAEPDACRLRFVHQGGATDGMDVTWRIEALDVDGALGARVSIEHDFAPPSAAGAAWAAFIDRFFTRPIAGRTLATFKALAETLADEPATKPAEAAE